MRRLASLRVVALLLSGLLVLVRCGDDTPVDPAQPVTPPSNSTESGDDGTDEEGGRDTQAGYIAMEQRRPL